MTTRLDEIKQWLLGLLPNIELSSLNYIQADASDRKYLRLSTPDNSFIVMDTKPGLEMTNFINIAKLLSQHELTVPQIIASDHERGLILMSDFGAQTYLSILKNGDLTQVNSLYQDAIVALIKIQTRATNQNIYPLPLMNAEYINDRTNVFKVWYLQRHLNLPDDQLTSKLIINLQNMFTTVFQQQPQVFVHLDYHSRNLMYLPNASNPGILDFQDAMYGPLTYDLVSLFQDAYITWPRSQVEHWVKVYQELALDAGLIENSDMALLLKQFDMTGLQRHIKNLGIFARLHYRDQKSNYLHDIPSLLNYITSTCARYPELAGLLEFLKGHILVEAGL